MINKFETVQCNGCKMCKDICPQGAIDYCTDHEGFRYPEINYNLYNYCKLYIKSCPQLNGSIGNKDEPEVFVAWGNDKEIRLKSNSGGIFYELAKEIINNGGYVIGTQYRQGFKSAEHMIINSFNGLQGLVGSKYFQTDTEGIYKKVKALLEEYKKVFLWNSLSTMVH